MRGDFRATAALTFFLAATSGQWAAAGKFDLSEEAEAPQAPARKSPAAARRLIATGGLTCLEGAAGGGLVPWALVSGYGTEDQVGGAVFFANARSNDYQLNSAGAAVGFYDRLEVSFAQQGFQLVGAVFPGNTIRQQVFGAKARLFGEAVYAQDSLWPQLAAGVQHKRNLDFGFIPRAVGARRDSGTDFYLAATKLYLAGVAGRNLLLSANVRATEANQLGLLGFGGDRGGYKAVFEGSAALFLNEKTALGGEYRQKPDSLSALREDDWMDAFVAYFPNKSLAAVAAYAWLGRVAGRDQSGPYLSLQVSY